MYRLLLVVALLVTSPLHAAAPEAPKSGAIGVLAPSTALAALTGGPQALWTILDETGSFAFSDGSSVYVFSADGTFELEPKGMSGRSIEGAWEKLDSSKIKVIGKWGWMNGLSSLDDYRRLVIHLNVIDPTPLPKEASGVVTTATVYPVYHTIEELVPVTKAEYDAAMAKVKPSTTK